MVCREARSAANLQLPWSRQGIMDGEFALGRWIMRVLEVPPCVPALPSSLDEKKMKMKEPPLEAEPVALTVFAGESSPGGTDARSD